MIKLVDDINIANCITHNGTMHADEVFATAFLELYLKDIKVKRISNINPSEFSEDVIIYDVGRGKFDHHQEDAKKRENDITYSSFGLLWQEFGLKFLEENKVFNAQDVFTEIDKDFIEGIDAIDNGVFPKIEADYKVKTLCDIIKLFNPSFNSNEEENEQFLKAVKVAKMILIEEFYSIIGKVTARVKVSEKIRENNSSHILILDEYMPYEETLQKEDTNKDILFVIFPSNRGGYVIKPVAKSFEDKSNRMDFPATWGGLTDEALEEATGVEGSQFCHTTLFLLTCKTLEQAKILVEKVLTLNQNKENEEVQNID